MHSPEVMQFVLEFKVEGTGLYYAMMIDSDHQIPCVSVWAFLSCPDLCVSKWIDALPTSDAICVPT